MFLFSFQNEYDSKSIRVFLYLYDENQSIFELLNITYS